MPHPWELTTARLAARPVCQRGIQCRLLVLVSLALSGALLPKSSGTPFDPEDKFVPACGGALLPDPPPGGWLLWSNRATWGAGGVPGVGHTKGANVTIPCRRGVLLDVPAVDVTVLHILGALKVRDHRALPTIRVSAAFVIVEGRFIIGTKKAQFSQKVKIELTPNPNNRANFLYTARQPADPANPRDLGHKAFAVVGGQVDFHGLPGPEGLLTWTRLAQSAKTGDSSIVVRDDVSNWPVGAPVALAPTDWSPGQDDVANVAAITSLGGSKWQVTLDKALSFNHFGDPRGVPDGFGGYIDETAEVALLTRNIVITGTDEAYPNQLEGGHFIVFFTNTKQILEGVEFRLMGQQGMLGRYNIHFHVAGDQSKNSVIRKNLIIHSKQRCVVIHATFNAYVDSNVAYNTSGHCFMIEEGGETGNTFINNLGMRTRAAKKLIPSRSNPSQSDETDDKPATFWITNPNNSYIGNSAAGSDDSGFWIELRKKTRGISAMWSRLQNIIPLNVPQVGVYKDNSAHSNTFAGFRAYPMGFSPRVNATMGKPWSGRPVWAKIGNFNLWKNLRFGAYLHGLDHVVYSNFSFADNVWAADMAQLQAVNISNSRFVGESSNFGNPSNCQYGWATWSCAPVKGCNFPLKAGEQGRSVPGSVAKLSLFGAVIEQNRYAEDGKLSTFIVDSTFSAFNPACKPAAAIAVGASRQLYWNSGDGIQGVRFDNKGGRVTNALFLFPKIWTEATGWVYNGGEVTSMFALHDVDGSLVGSKKGGYLVARNNSFLPRKGCSSNPAWNAAVCPGVCYRTVWITFLEPGFTPYPGGAYFDGSPKNQTDGPRVLGDFAYLKITRTVDGVSMSVEGNLRQYTLSAMFGQLPSQRFFAVSLLAGYTYEVEYIAGRTAPGFVPSNITAEFKDGYGCGVGLDLRFKGSSKGSYTWEVQETVKTTWAPCTGAEAGLTTSVAPHRFRSVCSSTASPPQQVVELIMGNHLQSNFPFTIVPRRTTAQPCSSDIRCGLVATSSVWAYNEEDLDLHPGPAGGLGFDDPNFRTSAPAWNKGPGVFGFSGWSWSAISTFLKPPEWKVRTYYYRTSFSLKDARCFSTLMLDVVVSDGVVVYLNGAEVLRANMPQGSVTNKTAPLGRTIATDARGYVYTPYVVSKVKFVEGSNVLASETHTSGAYVTAFAMRASAIRRARC